MEGPRDLPCVQSFGQGNTYFHFIMYVNDTEKQTDEEILKAKSGRVPSLSTGASVAMEMGCTPFPACKYPQPGSSSDWDFSGSFITQA